MVSFKLHVIILFHYIIIETSLNEKDYVVGLFDGSCRIYNAKNELLHNELLHKDSITDAGFIYVNQKCYLATASIDQTLHLYTYGAAVKTPELAYIGKYKHAITSLTQSMLNEKVFAAGTGDGNILLWDLDQLMEQKAETDEPEKKYKKKKIEVSELSIRKEISGILTQEVTDLQFIGPAQLLAGSMDHSIKVIDINKGAAVSTLHTFYAGVCAIDSTQNVVFAGLTDTTVRQWDLREASLKKTYGEGHTGWVKTVAINPLNRNVLVSGGYEGNVLVWDIRGDKKPMQKVCVQKDKVMAVGWNGPKKIVSGGSEGQLYIHSLTFDETE